MPTKTRPIQRALLSVSDKTGLVPFAQKLAARALRWSPQAAHGPRSRQRVCR